MDSKKILPHVAMTMYEEEMAPVWRAQRIAAEEDACYEQHAREEAERIAEETEASYFEREEELFLQELQEQETLEEEKKLFDEDLAVSMAKMSVEPTFSQKDSHRTYVYRRKQERRHKKKLRRNATNAMKNYGKRACEDMNNMTYCKRRGGQLVQTPKSLSLKAEKVWTKAAKQKLVTEYPA